MAFENKLRLEIQKFRNFSKFRLGFRLKSHPKYIFHELDRKLKTRFKKYILKVSFGIFKIRRESQEISLIIIIYDFRD